MIKPVAIFIVGLIISYQIFGMKALYTVGVLLGVLMSLVYFFQNKILYIPVIPNTSKSPAGNPFGYRHPSQNGLVTQDIEITTVDNVKLRGWLVKSQTSSRLVVYFHENAGNIGFRIPFLRELHQRTQSDVLLIAYRGFSDSEGEPTEEGLQKDAQAVMDYAIDYCSRDEKELFIFGRSLGGAVAAYAVTLPEFSNRINGIILQNTFSSIGDMVDHLFPVLSYVKFLQRNHWNSIDRVPSITIPILYIRSMKDEIVPTQQMQQLIQRTLNSTCKRQHRIQIGTHNVSWEYQVENYFQQLLSFFQNCKETQIELDDPIANTIESTKEL